MGEGSTTGFLCDSIISVFPEPVPSDLVVAVDPSLDMGQLLAFGDGLDLAQGVWDADVRLALLSPGEVGAMPGPDVCSPDGCVACDLPGGGLIQKVLGFDVPDNPLAILAPPEDYGCVVRQGQPPPSSRHMVFVTNRPDDPMVAMPSAASNFLVAEAMRMHAICPGCGATSGGRVVEVANEHLGQGFDLTADQVADVLAYFGASRSSCEWEYADLPPDREITVVISTASGDDLFVFEAAECTEYDGVGEVPLEFVRSGEGAGMVTLCPPACFFLQTEPYDGVAISNAYCERG